MTEKRCPACRKFKELQHFYNDGGFCVTRPSFKLCADCRARARSYFKKHSREYLPKGKYNKRESEFRSPVINIKQEEHCNVESDIMFNHNDVVYYVNPKDVLLFVGDCHLSEFKFQTLAEAREFRDWAFGILKAKI